MNAVDFSQQRIQLTEVTRFPPSALGTTCSNTMKTGFGNPSSKVSLCQVEISTTRSLKTTLSRCTDCGSTLDLYNRLMYLVPAQSNILTSYNFGPQIVPRDYGKYRIRSVSSSSLRYVTQLPTYIALGSPIGQLQCCQPSRPS